MREGGGWRRERKKLYCNGWIHVNELKEKNKEKKKKKKTHTCLVCLPFRKT